MRSDKAKRASKERNGEVGKRASRGGKDKASTVMKRSFFARSKGDLTHERRTHKRGKGEGHTRGQGKEKGS
jgi:hypothetical protein